ncbi:Uncharacterized protein Rs2_33818 [Raphanus sativus]|nr:Uncharacterized protein Rs2_33818 [Raphanus sativus]
MHRRLSSAEKGKAVALEHRPAPRTARVRLSEPDNSALLQSHALTIIGRVTNPSLQKVGALIPFFIDHWKADIPPVGSDLGSGMFQFRFELEADLLTVLAKQPYHYARWMIILERWIPTISPSFPSMIPFWIKIQGVPIHLWTDEVAEKIGEDIGTFETAEITPLSMRMRVHVNGRLPIIKSTTLEYPTGEVEATLVYEKLERHCLKCCKLDHELRDCLVAKHEKKDSRDSQEERRPKEPEHATARLERRLPTLNEDTKRLPLQLGNRLISHPRNYHNQRSHTSSVRDGRSESYHSLKSYSRQEWQPRDRHDRDQSRRNDVRPEYRSSYQPRDDYDNLRGDSHSISSHRHYSQHRRTDRGKESGSPIQQDSAPRRYRAISKERASSVEKGTPLQEQDQEEQRILPIVEMEEAVEVVRDVMSQYTSCADPVESAARRARLKKAEEAGQLERSAALIVAANARRASRESPAEDSPFTAEREPIANRLGPLNNSELSVLPEDRGSNERISAIARLGPQVDGTSLKEINAPDAPVEIIKRKPGRPPIRRTTTGSPIPGASSKKRKMQQASLPGIRKKNQGTQDRAEKAPKKVAGRRGATQDGVPLEEGSTTSDNTPICNLIPRTTRRRMDFRIQSNPVP